jgi:hypothetical protein
MPRYTLREWATAAVKSGTDEEYVATLVDLIEEGILVPTMNDGSPGVQFKAYRDYVDSKRH